MVQRFLFDGIDTVAAGKAVTGKNDLIILVFAHETQTALACVEFAETGAQIALNATVFQLVPVFRGNFVVHIREVGAGAPFFNPYLSGNLFTNRKP